LLGPGLYAVAAVNDARLARRRADVAGRELAPLAAVLRVGVVAVVALLAWLHDRVAANRLHTGRRTQTHADPAHLDRAARAASLAHVRRIAPLALRLLHDAI